MIEKEEQQRRKLFQEVIREMAQSQEVFKNPTKLEKVYKQLCKVYKGTSNTVDFRHYYSDIFSTLCLLKREGIQLEIVSQNLNEVYKYCKKKDDEEFCDKIKKLVDHTNLEVARINYVDDFEKKLNINGESFSLRINEINEQINDVTTKLEDAKKKMNNSYSDFIAILGVFAGIVLVFFGGTSILGNIIGNMQKMETVKAVMMCSITGIVVFDIIFMFIYYIAKLLDRNIAATNAPVWWESIFVRFKERYPLIFWVNIILGTIIFLCVIYYLLKIPFGTITLKEVVIYGINNLYVKHRNLVYVSLIGVLGNIIFLIAYIISKICKVDIGSSVFRSHAQWIDWEYNEEEDKYFVRDGEKNVKKFNSAKKAIWYTDTVRNIREFMATMKTVITISLLRYPYLTIFNIVIIGLVVYLLK